MLTSVFHVKRQGDALARKEPILQNPKKAAIWRTVSVVGAGLAAVGIAAFLADSLTISRFFGFIHDNYEVFLLAIGIGTLSLIAGLIGWFKYLDRSGRTRLGTIVLLAPIGIIILGGWIGTTNVHGPFFFIVLPMFPVSVLGSVLLLIARISRDTTDKLSG